MQFRQNLLRNVGGRVDSPIIILLSLCRWQEPGARGGCPSKGLSAYFTIVLLMIPVCLAYSGSAQLLVKLNYCKKNLYIFLIICIEDLMILHFSVLTTNLHYTLASLTTKIHYFLITQ